MGTGGGINPRKCQLRHVFGSTPQVWAASRQLSNNRLTSLFLFFIRLAFIRCLGKLEQFHNSCNEETAMTNDDIRPGQCWMARLTKSDLCVRLESRTPNGGWIARTMLHGRKIKIENEIALLRRCDTVKNYAAADATKRYRRVPPPVEPTPGKSVTKREKTVAETIQEPLVLLPLLEAAAVVLQESTTALTTREIIALVIEKKLWQPSGKTPWATLSAALNRDMQSKGTQSRFKKRERGRYALR